MLDVADAVRKEQMPRYQRSAITLIGATCVEKDGVFFGPPAAAPLLEKWTYGTSERCFREKCNGGAWGNSQVSLI